MATGSQDAVPADDISSLEDGSGTSGTANMSPEGRGIFRALGEVFDATFGGTPRKQAETSEAQDAPVPEMPFASAAPMALRPATLPAAQGTGTDEPMGFELERPAFLQDPPIGHGGSHPTCRR